jgi:hypothetical protein
VLGALSATGAPVFGATSVSADTSAPSPEPTAAPSYDSTGDDMTRLGVIIFIAATAAFCIFFVVKQLGQFDSGSLRTVAADNELVVAGIYKQT